MMSWFDDETALHAVGEGSWAGFVSAQWCIGENPNGGYLVAMCARALRELGPHRDPISITTHFLRPGSADEPAEVHTELVRRGRTITTGRASLVQDGKQRLEVVASFADLSLAPDASPDLTIPGPHMPAPDDCPQRSGAEQGIDLPILDRLDVRIHPDQVRAGQAGAAEVSGWIRLADGCDADVLSLLVFADAFPPSLFGLLGVVGWVPTVELTVHVRRRPVSGWILGRFVVEDLHDGRMIESGELWDESGALVARSRQLGLLLPR